MSEHLSQEVCDRLLKSFAKHTSSKASLPIGEVAIILQKSGLSLPDQHIKQLVSSWDLDRDGLINYDDLSRGLQRSHTEVEEEICMAAFVQIDKNRDGVLCA